MATPMLANPVMLDTTKNPLLVKAIRASGFWCMAVSATALCWRLARASSVSGPLHPRSRRCRLQGERGLTRKRSAQYLEKPECRALTQKFNQPSRLGSRFEINATVSRSSFLNVMTTKPRKINQNTDVHCPSLTPHKVNTLAPATATAE